MMPLFADLPEAEFLHAHCDGGSRGNPGPSGFGAVIADAQGRKVAELSEYLGIRTNNYAEYSGLLAVLGWALEHGHGRLKVVSDSELMVKQIQGRYKVNSPDLKPLWQEARSRIAKLEKFEISHALRHKNKEADALANQAMDRGMGRGGSAAAPGVVALPLRARAVVQAGAGTNAAQPIPVVRAGSSRKNAEGEMSGTAEGEAKPAAMLRGFTRGGAVHLLGGATLPDGVFVKVIPE